MPEPKRPLKVFLCHASTDKPKVRELYRYLRRRGINPWFDEEHLVGGQDWQVEIPKALATSDAIIICLTKNSVDKEGYIQKEIKFALDKALEMPEGKIFLIPVKFEECEVPFTLSRYQWVDLTIESGYSKMMKALKFRASQLERSTVELSKKVVEEENRVLEKSNHEWNEGSQFEKQLPGAINAEEIAREAESLFSQGRIDDAIEKVELASGLTGYPKYKLTAERYRAFKLEIKAIHEILFSGILTLEPMLEALKKLTSMSTQNPGNQALHTLYGRFNNLKPILAEKIKQEVREIKSRVESAESLDISYSEIEKAKYLLDDAMNSTIADDASFLSLSRDVSRIKSDIERYKNDISKANNAYRNNRGWPIHAWQLSQDVRRYYPSDPDVAKLKSHLRSFERLLITMRVMGVIVGMIFFGFLVMWTSNNIKAYALSLTPSPIFTTTSLSSTPVSTPTIMRTVKPSATPTLLKTLTPPSLLTEITDTKGVPMALVTTNGIASFYMDKYEVTNKFYKDCVSDGACLPPTNTTYFNQPSYLNHPVVYVDHEMAKNYCDWRDASLPTLSDWEQASTVNAAKIYPWGNEISCDNANFASELEQVLYRNGTFSHFVSVGCVEKTTPVGSYELGKSIFNIYDLIGNVAEWASSSNEILGGSWTNNKPSGVQILVNTTIPISKNTIGFRCMSDENP